MHRFSEGWGLAGAGQHPRGCREHLAAAASSVFLLPGKERFHISSLTDAVQLQPGLVLNQPQMGHLLLPGGGESAWSLAGFGDAGQGPSDWQVIALTWCSACREPCKLLVNPHKMDDEPHAFPIYRWRKER